MTTVLIVDDQPLQRYGFRILLETAPETEVVGEAGHGAEAIRQAAELRPDVVLMDVRMPGIDGIEATRRIVGAGGRSRVLRPPGPQITHNPPPSAVPVTIAGTGLTAWGHWLGPRRSSVPQ